jgi:hypothetical protein
VMMQIQGARVPGRFAGVLSSIESLLTLMCASLPAESVGL